ncbi:hypothetical protein, partial [Salmonella sp. s59443]|uniref:hypothetical protein n=1 Tax=Salmonella sp. s59443 TaxID=3159717 RepID=UPI00397EB1E2
TLYLDDSLPILEGDLKGPNVDISRPDVGNEEQKSKIKSPKYKKTEMNIKAPKISMPDFYRDI